MSTYLDIEVLERRENAREARQESFHRLLSTLDPGLGPRSVRARDAAPAVDRPYLWTCRNRAEIRAFQAWLAVRRGRLVPLWVPTWRRDLLLVQGVGASDPGISIQPCGYTQYAFLQKARQHVSFFLPDGSLACRRVLQAQDNGASETLTLASALGQAAPVGTLVCFLTYCRLASDDVELTYITDSIAEAQLHFVEIPEEAP